MKICWDNLEGVRLTIHGNFRIGESTYTEMDSCKTCGEPYLVQNQRPSLFCCHPCSMIGKVRSIETKKRMSATQTGKVRSIETKKRMSAAQTGRTRSAEEKKKMSERMSKRVGVLNYNYKGGIKALGLTTYDTNQEVLGLYEDVRKQIDTEILEAKCVYCGKWYPPTYKSVTSRLTAVSSLNKGECRLYCSENCKQACPTYGQKLYPKGFKHTTSREVDPYLRQMVFELDNWECQICGASGINITLHCHHILGYAQNKMFANDVNNCITLCKGCHNMVHSRKGCRYIDLVCKKTV